MMLDEKWGKEEPLNHLLDITQFSLKGEISP